MVLLDHGVAGGIWRAHRDLGGQAAPWARFRQVHRPSDGGADASDTELENSLFVQTATGLGLKKLTRSQFQLEPFPRRRSWRCSRSPL